MQSQVCSVLHFLAQPFYPPISPLPVLIVLHAIRVSISWHQLRPAKSGSRGSFLQDLYGYWVLAFGGSTLTAIILREPIIWLTSPMIILIYTSLHLLLQPIIPTILRLSPPNALTALLTIFDSLCRSFSLLSIHTNLTAHPDSLIGPNPLAGPILSAINVSGGRTLVSLFGLSNPEWTLQTPEIFSSGHLEPWVRFADTWSAVLGIGVLQWSDRSPDTLDFGDREEQALCALTVAGCLIAVKILASQRDDRLSPRSLPKDSSPKDVVGLAESSVPSNLTIDDLSTPKSSFDLSSSLPSSPASPSTPPSLMKPLLSASEPSSPSGTTPIAHSPPPVIHRDFFKAGVSLSEGRRKTIEIRNKELRRRADELGGTTPLIIPYASTSSTPSSSSSYSPSSSPSSPAATVSGIRAEKISWNNEPTLMKNRTFAGLGLGKSKIKKILGGK